VSALGRPRAGWIALAAVAALAVGARGSHARHTAESVLEREPPELVARLLKERLVVLEDVHGDGSESFIISYVIFERSRSEVVDLMKQAERQPEYRPELKSVKTVERFEGGRVDEQSMKIMFRKMVYRLRYQRDAETGRLEWKLDPSFDNDLRRLEGFWELYEFVETRERTLGRFGSRVDVGRSVPRFIQKGMSRKTVLRYVDNCRMWIDSDGKWRP
jgi:hypothetical protein